MQPQLDLNDVLTHFQDNATEYLVFLGLGAVVVLLTRRYTVPVLQYILEIAIYLVGVHLVMHGLVLVAKWFKEQSTFRPKGERAIPLVDWGTPSIEFWTPSLYSPQFVFYIEATIALLIIGIVLKYRPMQTQRKLRERTDAGGGKGKNSAFSGSAQSNFKQKTKQFKAAGKKK